MQQQQLVVCALEPWRQPSKGCPGAMETAQQREVHLQGRQAWPFKMMAATTTSCLLHANNNYSSSSSSVSGSTGDCFMLGLEAPSDPPQKSPTDLNPDAAMTQDDPIHPHPRHPAPNNPTLSHPGTATQQDENARTKNKEKYGRHASPAPIGVLRRQAAKTITEVTDACTPTSRTEEPSKKGEPTLTGEKYTGVGEGRVAVTLSPRHLAATSCAATALK